MSYFPLGELISKARVEKCGDRDFPVLSMTMHDGIVFQNDRFKKDIASVDRSNYSVVQYDQLVVSFPIDEGVLAVQNVTEAGIVSPAYKIWNVDQDMIVPKYLEMWLRSPKSIDYYKSKLRGTTARRRSIPEEDFLSMPVAVPSIESQLNAVDLIARVKQIIEKRESELSALDDLIKARFVEMFEEPVSKQGPKEKLSETGKVYTGNTPSMKVPEYYESDDIPFIKPGDIAESGVTTVRDAASFISKKGRDAARVMPKGSVLVTCIGTIGKVGIVAQESCCNQQINFIVPNDRYNPIYLAHCLSFFKNVLTDMANAPVVPIINKSLFSALEIPTASKIEQDSFAAFVSQIDKSKSVIQKSLDETQLLFDSLMQKYFG